MTDQGGARFGGQFLTPPTLLLTAAFVIPALFPYLFGWFKAFFLAVPVLYILRAFEAERAGKIIRNAFILIGVIGIILHHILPDLILSLALVPLGYTLHHGGAKGENPVLAGGRGVLVLGLIWLVLAFGYGVSENVNPYSQIKQDIDTLLLLQLEEINHSDFPAENLLKASQAVTELRSLFPRILPGLLGCMLVVTVWMNQIVGNGILRRLRPENAPWPEYCSWKIPEKFIWAFITSAIIFLLGNNGVRDFGLSLVIVCGVIYFFQGLAIFVHFLQKWNAPWYFAVIFLILVLQGMGLILTMLGVADVWIDFRRPRHNE